MLERPLPEPSAEAHSETGTMKQKAATTGILSGMDVPGQPVFDSLTDDGGDVKIADD